MGCSYYAHTVVGLKINKQDLIIQKTFKHKLCKCEKNSADFKYCPSCGKTNKFGSYTVNKYIDSYLESNPDDSDDDGDENKHGILTINGTKYKVFQIKGMQNMFISIHSEYCDVENSNYSCTALPYSLETLCELKQKLMEDLQSINFWKNNDFANNFNKNFKIYLLSEIS